MHQYSKQSLTDAIRAINAQGWIENRYRMGNDGAIGNMLEDLLGLDENNLPIPNAAEWELKCSRTGSNALMTLFHLEPSPRAYRFVPRLLELYGWRHAKAGTKYPDNERSFRQTIHATGYSNRGFTVIVNDTQGRVEISFDAKHVDDKHRDWLQGVEIHVGLDQLDPQPYWGFADLGHKAGTKLKNMFYVKATRHREGGKEYFRYDQAMILSDFDRDLFIKAIRNGDVYVDFDARTGHNHGTKFRLRSNKLPALYRHVDVIIE